MKFRITIVIHFWLLFLVSLNVNAQETKESFYSQATRAVVRLQHREDLKREGQDKFVPGIKSDGTGFFVHTIDSLFIVTAAHVARQEYDLHAMVPLKREAGGELELWELRLPRSEWVFHPNKGSEKTYPVDVAVMKIPSNKDWGTIAFRYCEKDCPEKEYNQLSNDGLSPPAQVVVLGFPLDIGLTLKEPRPMARHGIIALRTDEEFIKVEGKYFENRAFLIEAAMFPGNSGGPVIHVPLLGGNLQLAGLVSASNSSLTYAVITSVSRIREVLDIAKGKAIGKQGWFRSNL